MKKATISSLIIALLIGFASVSAQNLIEKGSTWKYLDDGSDQGKAWKEVNFDDSQWKSGEGVLGYGDKIKAKTVLNFGNDKENKFLTYYFRSTFKYTPAEGKDYCLLNLNADDGAVIYINGNEILRVRMPSSAFNYATRAASSGGSGGVYDAFELPISSLSEGLNTIAIEIHQRSPGSSDIALDVELYVGEKPKFDVEQIRFGSFGNALNDVVVTWRSSGEADKIKWGYTNAYEKGEFKASKRDNYYGNNFDYKFPALTGGKTIYYRIYNSQLDEWKDEMTYKTASDASNNKYTFTVLGDSRTYPEEWGEIARSTEQADFTLYMGDIISDGASFAGWDNWFKYGKDFIANQVIFHTIGNHDKDDSPSELENFKSLFSLPGNEKYYSFTNGNALFVCLNTEDEENEDQYEFLKKTLEANKDMEWKFIFFHKPFFTSPSHVGEMDMNLDTWWKTFDAYGVDMIFNGHTHNYQRTNPINREVSTTSPVAEYGSEKGQGRCQIVTGAAGAPFSDMPKPNWWLNNGTAGVLHFCKIEIDNDVLSFKAISSTKEVIDEFTIDKSGNK